MLLPIVVSIFLGAWGLLPSLPEAKQAGAIVTPTPGNRTEPEQTAKKQQSESQNPSQSPSPPSRVNEVTARQKTRTTEHQSRDVWEKAFAPETWTNWLLAVAGIVGIGIAICTLNSLKEQIADGKIVAQAAKTSADTSTKAIQLSEDMAKRELRAYVSVQPKFVWRFNNPPQLPFIETAVINHGKTPAFEISNVYEIQVHPEGFEPPIEAHQHNTAQAAAFPNVDLAANFIAPRTFTPEEMGGVLHGTHRIFLWGTMSYRDAFKELRWTRFSASVGGDDFRAVMERVQNASYRWGYGNHHNETSES
jgi:hypothetical protein